MENDVNKRIGICTLVLVVLLSAIAFYFFQGYHSSELGTTHSTVPTEVPVPPMEPQKN
jgi:hypothetical protein